MAEKKRAVKRKAVLTASSLKKLAAPYRGVIRGLDAIQSRLVFTTEHEEGQATAIYQFDLATEKLQTTALDCGVTAQLLVGEQLWFGGTDNVLRSMMLGKKPSRVGDAFDAPIIAIAKYAGGVAVVAGESLYLVDTKGKRTAFDLAEPGRSVASDPTGQWVVAGTKRGHICVFTSADGEFAEVSRTRLHDGEVTALAFAPDELRVYSTGSDCRLLVSFVRGALDTEDRGGNNMHEKEVTTILMGPDFVTAEGTRARFYTAGTDGTINAWPRGREGSQRPAAQGTGVVKTSDLAIVELEGNPYLAAAGFDGTIRVFAFDEVGRVADHVITLQDAYALATGHLGSSKPKEREAALVDLAVYGDRRALSMISAHVSGTETDHKLQVRGVELLATVDHRQTAKYLGDFFGHSASDVRLAAFAGLRKIKGADDLDVLRKATQSGHDDLGLQAVREAAKLKTDASIELVRQGLDHSAPVVRFASLTELEKLYPKSAQGTLLGLKASQADVRRIALSRVLERSLLGDTAVAAQLRRMWSDSDDRVRLWAFVVATHRSANLVLALRAADDEFHRHIFELEELPKEESKRRKAPPAAKAFDPKKLAEDDFRPLIEAMGARSLDVSLRAARGLASLGDDRSFGTLLQLSREPDAGARVSVCKALAVLGDPRSIKRIRAMLHDSDDQVRDAAFTALASLQADEPYATARAGLSASAINVRERALALLAKKAKSKKGVTDEARTLFSMALNDGAPAIRQEAFKAVLNLAPADQIPPTLEFILQSVHADVRNEVLQEAKAKPKDGAFRAVLLKIVDDPDAANRTEALNHALDKWPSKEHAAVYRAALESRFADQRVAAVRKLSEEKGDLRALLVEALDDSDTNVRLEAVRALVRAENRKLLVDAVGSEHLDVRVEAASALAVLGDERSLKPLTEVIEGYHALIAQPANADDIEAYKPRLQSALTGLIHLGHPDSIDAVLTLFDGDAAVASAAASTLPAIAHPSNLDKVRELAKHENANVRLLCALALAYNGDDSQAGAVFGKTDAYFELFAALGLRDKSSERLLAYVDASNEKVQKIALAMVLALELTEHASDGVPERCLSLLSANSPTIRLSAGQALEHYHDQPAFYAWVYATLNALSSPPDAWSAEPRKLLVLSRAISLGEPRLAVRAGQILGQLLEPKGDEFERQFRLFEDRFKGTLQELEKRANARKAAPLTDRVATAWKRIKAKARSIAVEPTTFDEALQTLAFGAYIGLARQVDTSAPAIGARTAAITGLVRLAPINARFKADASAVILLSLGDSTQTVRERGFQALVELGCARDVLSTEALSTGFPDMGLKGLELLASDKKGGNALLEQTLLESTNGLEEQAAKLLVDRVGQVAVYRIGLGAASESFRTASVRGLAREAAASDDAAKALREALSSGHDDVRFLAAQLLANRKDPVAYDTLIDMLASDEAGRQREAVKGLQQLRDERAPHAILDRIDNNDDETADVGTLLEYVVTFDDPSIAPRLIGMVDADRHRSEAFHAAHQLSGYPQYEWMEIEEVTPKWEATLKPRHPDVFASLLDLAYRIADHDMLSSLVPLSRWPAENEELDRTLGALLRFSDENIRHNAVEMVGWRARHRNGPSDGLRDILTSRDPLDQFYAAEGLALSGEADGLAVLRTAIAAMDDWSLKERAVLAVGVLADPSTLDMLLALVTDPDGYMQETAAEALGHMSQSARSDEVFSTLRGLLSEYNVREGAMKGLRWFGTPGAWDILRGLAEHEDWSVAQQAVELLRHDESSKELIAKVLRENDDWDVAGSAADSLRYLWGPDSLEPDYAIMQAAVGELDETDEAFDRLRKDGDVGRILDVMSRIHEDNEDEFLPRLTAIVLGRDPLPIDDVAPMLASDKSRTAALAAQILGRGGAPAAKKHGKTLAAATKSTREAWLATWSDFLANRRGAREKITAISEAYRRMVWACGQLQVAKDEVLAAARLPDHELALPIREEALTTLGESWVGKDGVSALLALARGGDARLRSMAAAELDRCAPAESAKLLSETVHDDVSFGRLLNSLAAKDAQKPLRQAVDKAAGIALPRLAALGDIEGLLAAMQNGELNDSTRRGAIDALATIASSDVAKRLAAFGADEKQDELLRKAAWRARRRVTRAVAAQEAP